LLTAASSQLGVDPGARRSSIRKAAISRPHDSEEERMKYMLIFVGPETDEQGERSPEELQAAMDAWSQYSKELADAGAYIAGEGLQPSATATTVTHAPGGERIVSDGPFAETKEQVGGFYLLECSSLDEALDWAKKAPVHEGNSTEVRPVMDYTGSGYEEPDTSKATA
jgi:hypothetical protein